MSDDQITNIFDSMGAMLFSNQEKKSSAQDFPGHASSIKEFRKCYLGSAGLMVTSYIQRLACHDLTENRAKLGVVHCLNSFSGVYVYFSSSLFTIRFLYKINQVSHKIQNYRKNIPKKARRC